MKMGKTHNILNYEIPLKEYALKLDLNLKYVTMNNIHHLWCMSLWNYFVYMNFARALQWNHDW